MIEKDTNKELNKEERDKDAERFQKFLRTIFYISDIAGFHFEERIVVKDIRSGKIYK